MYRKMSLNIFKSATTNMNRNSNMYYLKLYTLTLHMKIRTSTSYPEIDISRVAFFVVYIISKDS
jgi:hypothetical protein